jgi:hypothetical protein
MFVLERTGFDEAPIRDSISINPNLLKTGWLIGLQLAITI